MKKEKRNPMLHSDSQEQTIYRKLAERIQLGFYSDGERFPTVQDVHRSPPSVSIRGIVNHCPLEMIREIYTKLTPLLLNGNTLQLDGVESRTVTDWPAASKAIAHAILQRDGGKFAFELRRLAENIFTAMKRYILQDGLESAAQIVTPDFHD